MALDAGAETCFVASCWLRGKLLIGVLTIVKDDSMKPIVFCCSADVSQTLEQIAEQILEVANWSDFQGFGPLPGIRRAEFEIRTDEIVGSRIKVHNTDGSTHIEQIVEWQPQRLSLIHI